MIEILLLLAAGLLGWLFARRQKPTEPSVIPPKKNTDPPKYEDKIDATVQAASDPTPDPMPDGDLAAWLDDHFKGKRK